MATNDFLTFATGGSANVLTQAQWAALSALLNGFQSGVADSKSINKAFRQSSIMSSVLAQFIVAQTGQNAVDDGTTATLLANLLSAVKASSNAVVGGVRNLSMSVAAASASATITADEVIVESALGGFTYKLANFNKTLNLATTGPGGIDYAGTVPANGFIGIYAIYNPTTGASAVVAQGGNVLLPEIYSNGAAIPSLGYTASALLAVVPTNASGQIQPCAVADRVMTIPNTSMFATSATAASPTIVNNLAVPLNAKFCSGWMQAGSTVAGAVNMSLQASNSTASVGAKTMALTISAGSSIAVPFDRLRITVGQRAFYTGSGGGTASFGATVNQYEI